jgi:menaquinone-dependent protoporphyrinogen oxidase
MASLLVAFESKYGQGSKIAEHIGETARRRGHDARVLHFENLHGAELPQYDALAVVAPVYFGKHTSAMRSFLHAHLADLTGARRSAFFSVSNSAASHDEKARSEARRIAEAFPRELGWVPGHVATVAGAIAYPRYNFLLRFVMKRIPASKGDPTDTRRVHELTDWGRLDTDIAAMLAPLEEREPARAPVATA